jgi:hypothetical protein
MKNDESLPSLPRRVCGSGISTPVAYHSFGTPKRPLDRIRVWRSPDVEQQNREWRKAHARQIEESDVFWRLRMRGRP